jgi:hypothetical protein
VQGRVVGVTADVLDVLREAGVEVIPFAVALNSALVTAGRPSEFDVLGARLDLDSLWARTPDEHRAYP